MPEKKNLTVVCRPTRLLKRMLKNSGDVSEGNKHKLIATRMILKKKVNFYANGLRIIEGTALDEQDAHDSEILRFAHASIFTGGPVGDKALCYVDATKSPVEVWIYGMLLEQFLKTSKNLVGNKQLDLEFLLEEPIRNTMELKNGRNVRLFGRQLS